MESKSSRIDRLYSFFNAIRGNNTPTEYESTLAVLKKTMDLQAVAVDEDFNQCELSDEQLYELMRDVADEFGVANPFPDRERFFDVYRTFRNFDIA